MVSGNFGKDDVDNDNNEPAWDEDLDHQTYGEDGRRVTRGDCIMSLAWSGRVKYDWKTIWSHGKNSQIKEKREDQNILYRGDFAHILEREEKWANAADQKKHTFRCRQRWTMLRLRCQHYGEPLGNEPYTLEVGEEKYEGKTDSEGQIEEKILVTETYAKLRVGEGDDAIEYGLAIGTLDPINTVEGVKARLNNLGYAVGHVNRRETDDLRRALLRFQHDHGLHLTGIADEDTQEKLEDVYGA